MIDINHLRKMANGRLRNYVVPGLDSSLIGGGRFGCVRLFECSREHAETIVPHSHRFDFQCLVLSGSVVNVLWETSKVEIDDADPYMASRLIYCGESGRYHKEQRGVIWARHKKKAFYEGDTYSMSHKEIHSIFFSRGAKVLFFEGPNVSSESVILEPYVNGVAIPTMKVEPWMFEKVES